MLREEDEPYSPDNEAPNTPPIVGINEKADVHKLFACEWQLKACCAFIAHYLIMLSVTFALKYCV